MTCRISELIAPPFYDIHRAVKNHDYTYYDLAGGRGSTKSSFASIEMILIILRYPEVNGLVLRKVANTLRDSVFAQYCWAISALNLDKHFITKVSPMEIIYKKTGQKILFRGADDKSKIKSIKVSKGYIGAVHVEEKDQFAGREELRNIYQSVLRGGDLYWVFETYNPPISLSNWANKDSLIKKPSTLYHKSTYLDVPREWLGEQFIEDAEFLKEINPKAYEHEYIGNPVGNGGNVFENVEIRDITDEEISHFDRIYKGIDWGWYPDPFAYNNMYFDMARRTLYIFDELHCNKKSNRETADMLIDKGVGYDERITADSAENKSVGDYKTYGFFIRGAKKGPGSVDYSMKWLQSLAKIVIDSKRCPYTADEFIKYEYERNKDDEIITGYPDKDNHHIDAVRYALEEIWSRRGQ